MMKRSICILVAVFIISAVGAISFASAETIVSQSYSQNEIAAAKAHWTRQAMMNAKPCPMPTLKRSRATQADNAILSNDGATGPPGEVKSAKPLSKSALLSGDPSEAMAVAETAEPTAGVVLMGGYDYPPPHTTFYVHNGFYSVFPYKAVGKVFFSEGGFDYVCSGASIGGKAVLTAGHCVSDGSETYHTNWSFVPAYKNGAAPYGTWPASQLFALSTWHTSEDFARDVGFAVTVNQGGKKLSETVGNLGFKYNSGRKIHWNMFGYPADGSYNGEFMVETQASYAVSDSSVTPATNGIGTTQTPGCSGGPWIVKFRPKTGGEYNLANGVNSYKYEGEDGQIYSSYFDTTVYNLYSTVIVK